MWWLWQDWHYRYHGLELFRLCNNIYGYTGTVSYKHHLTKNQPVPISYALQNKLVPVSMRGFIETILTKKYLLLVFRKFESS